MNISITDQLADKQIIRRQASKWISRDSFHQRYTHSYPHYNHIHIQANVVSLRLVWMLLLLLYVLLSFFLMALVLPLKNDGARVSSSSISFNHCRFFSAHIHINIMYTYLAVAFHLFHSASIIFTGRMVSTSLYALYVFYLHTKTIFYFYFIL